MNVVASTTERAARNEGSAMDPIIERELAADAARPSPGALLRTARERQGMHVATLAAAIKVSTHKIEALEADRWDELPGPTFTRALAQAVCRVLKTDPRPVLVLLPPADTSMLDSTVGNLNEPFAGRAGSDTSLGGFKPGPIVWAALVLLLAALALWFVPKGWFSRLTGQAAQTGPASQAAPTTAQSGQRAAAPATTAPAAAQPIALPAFPAAPAASGATPAPGPNATGIAPAAQSVPPAALGTPGSATPATTTPATPATATAGATPSAGAAAPAAPSPAPPAAALVLRSTAASWVEVRDAAGRVLVSRTLLPEEPVALDGAAPLQVVVGNATATQVIYKGRLVVLTPVGRDNVARVELR
jgi:cytoskeleton protein RodZ